MQVQRLPLAAAQDQLLLHNVVDHQGRRILRKGIRLQPEQLQQLEGLGWQEVEVAILDADDIPEEEAATRLTGVLQNELIDIAWGVGGRANFHTTVSGVLHVDVQRLIAINMLPGIALSTLPPYSVVHPRFTHQRQTQGQGDQVATLKIIPYAVPTTVVEAFESIASLAPLFTIHPLLYHRVALLITADPSAQTRLQLQFDPPIRKRIEQLNSTVETVAFAEQNEASICAQVETLLQQHDMLVIVGQTSIMDMDDLTLRALRSVGISDLLHGAPVDPGNLLAVGAFANKPILCAPGCARSLKRNVVDLVLPRLLSGERLGRAEIAQLAPGGLLG